MSDVINKSTLQQLQSVNTPSYAPASWIINPDLSELDGVPKKYWKISGDTVIEMTQGEKDGVDWQEILDTIVLHKQQVIDFLYNNETALPEITLTESGLTVTGNFGYLVADQQGTITADPSETKWIKVALVQVEATQTCSFQLYEKTTGEYADLAAGELLIKPVKEYSLVAAGTTLVIEQDFI